MSWTWGPTGRMVSASAGGRNVFTLQDVVESGALSQGSYSALGQPLLLKKFFDDCFLPTGASYSAASNGNSLWSQNLDYFGDGNIKTSTRTDGAGRALAATYVYDSLDRLCSATLAGTAGDGKWLGGTLSYALDDLGNLTGESVTSLTPPAGKNAYAQFPAGGFSASVDASTNRLKSLTAGGKSLSTVTYNILGNQTLVSGPAGEALNLEYLDQGHALKVKDSGGKNVASYCWDACGKGR